MFRKSNSDWLRGVGVCEVPACAGHLLHHNDESGVVAVVRAARSNTAAVRDDAIADGALLDAVNQDVTLMHLLSPVSPMVATLALTDPVASSHAAFDLRAHKPSQVADVHVLSTATEKEKRLARRFQQVDGALLQRTRAELTEPEFDNLACTLDYLEDFIVAQAHAPLGTASDGSALGCYLSRLGHAYVVDAGHVVHDLREPLAASVLATRAKRRATEALGVQSPTPAPAFAAERADTHCTAAAWSHALRAANGVAVPLWLAVGTRSGRVSVLQLALVDHHFRLPQPAVVIDVVPGNEGSAVTALHFAVDSQHVVVGFADGSVVAFDLAASGARTVLLERSPAHNTAAVALYEHARCGLFVARATDLFALPSIKSVGSGGGGGGGGGKRAPPLRWRAHNTALTGLSGGVAHDQSALVTSAYDGTVHYWILGDAPLRKAPTPIVLRRSGAGAVIGCALADNTVLVYKMSGSDVRASFAVMRETGLVEALLAPWSSERSTPPPAAAINWSAPPRWATSRRCSTTHSTNRHCIRRAKSTSVRSMCAARCTRFSPSPTQYAPPTSALSILPCTTPPSSGTRTRCSSGVRASERTGARLVLVRRACRAALPAVQRARNGARTQYARPTGV